MLFWSTALCHQHALYATRFGVCFTPSCILSPNTGFPFFHVGINFGDDLVLRRGSAKGINELASRVHEVEAKMAEGRVVIQSVKGGPAVCERFSAHTHKIE